MFCTGCGVEIGGKSRYCEKCGQDLSEYLDEFPQDDFGFETSQKFEEELNWEITDETEESRSELNTRSMKPDKSNVAYSEDAKISNLVDLISRLQEENKQLREELEKYNGGKNQTGTSNFGRRKMPKPAKEKKDDVVSKFKKWYNE